ncbi:hypothetical protein BGZ61DRAFT_219887 [Ilyonectria robusta]|uniref:uncharacterized protein n=1 Tax=Ilyonectria robusta TaxID=1079257 RepID=UPI001E8D54F7|nr:uncharacterized protein BGZ61DRAFT_219887 [Ilyonectria robusta]KAH8706362.1 hypothetical protein BGZ61DRAFT_219887 [Ilyonectria robusta]
MKERLDPDGVDAVVLYRWREGEHLWGFVGGWLSRPGEELLAQATGDKTRSNRLGPEVCGRGEWAGLQSAYMRGSSELDQRDSRMVDAGPRHMSLRCHFIPPVLSCQCPLPSGSPQCPAQGVCFRAVMFLRANVEPLGAEPMGREFCRGRLG